MARHPERMEVPVSERVAEWLQLEVSEEISEEVFRYIRESLGEIEIRSERELQKERESILLWLEKLGRSEEITEGDFEDFMGFLERFGNTNNFWNLFKPSTIKEIKEGLNLYTEAYDEAKEDGWEEDFKQENTFEKYLGYWGPTLFLMIRSGKLKHAIKEVGEERFLLFLDVAAKKRTLAENVDYYQVLHKLALEIFKKGIPKSMICQ
jgi:hypothetical protein